MKTAILICWTRKNMMKWNKTLFIGTYLMLVQGVYSQVQPWTWCYQKIFSHDRLEANSNKGSMTFEKVGVPNFTQLIFSWNALRPKLGYFQFNVQVRDSKTKRWSDLYRMAEWGANVQRSFYQKSYGAIFNHVRLDVSPRRHADGLRISVEALEGARLNNLRGLFVCISHLRNFERESHDDAITRLPSIVLSSVPRQSQKVLDHPKKEVLCSPTSCCMLTSYLLKKLLDPVEFAHQSYDNGLNIYGSWPFNTAHAFEHARGKCFFYVSRLESFAKVYSMLKKGIPVVVSVRGHLEGAFKEYDDGHLLVIIGWDQSQKKVVCHDPAFETNEETRVSYDVIPFMRAWERSHRLAYCAMMIK
jgi:Peptidase_C39 like family